MMNPVRVFMCAMLMAASAAAQSLSPAALTQAIAATESAKRPYAFRMELTDGQGTAVAHFDPREQPHLRLIAPNRSSMSQSLRQGFDSAAPRLEGLTWCARTSLAHIANVRLVREDAATATYSFQPTRDSASDQMRPFVDHLRGELTMAKQPLDLVSIHVFAPAAFSPAIGVNAERFDVLQNCAIAPNGRRYATEIVTDERFTVFGRAIASRYVRRFTELEAR